MFLRIQILSRKKVLHVFSQILPMVVLLCKREKRRCCCVIRYRTAAPRHLSKGCMPPKSVSGERTALFDPKVCSPPWLPMAGAYKHSTCTKNGVLERDSDGRGGKRRAIRVRAQLG